MKKLVFVSMTFLFVLTMIQLVAKTTVDKGVMTKEVKSISTDFKEIEASKVSTSTKRRFNVDFGSVSNVVWEKSKSLSKATFTLNGRKMTAFYNSDSKLVGTTSAQRFVDLPTQAQAQLKTLYKDYSITSVVLFDNDGANKTETLKNGNALLDNENFLVALIKDNRTIIIRVDLIGETPYFKQI